MLRPNTPPEGKPKPPNTPNNPRVGQYLKAAGQAVDIDFTGKCNRSPNTLLAHCLLEYALEKCGPTKQNEVQEALFQSYFTDGNFPDVDNLTKVAESCGLDKDVVEGVLNDENRLRNLQKTIKRNSASVPSGVPFFVFNGRPAFSGAQDPSTFHEVFDMLLE